MQWSRDWLTGMFTHTISCRELQEQPCLLCMPRVLQHISLCCSLPWAASKLHTHK